MRRTLVFTSLAIVLGQTLPACRNARRPVRVGNDAATLTVTLSNLAPEDENRPEWLYELSGCIAPVTGNLTAPKTVTFSAVGLKVGLTGCQLRIRTLKDTPGMTFEGEPNVFYFVKDMSTEQDVDGQLRAQATVTRLYGSTGTAAELFVLRVPVTFAAADKSALLVGQIACTPAITAPGSFERASDTAGELVFSTEIAVEAPYQCTTLDMRDGSNAPLHTGTFLGDSGKFTARPGATHTVAPSLALVKARGAGVEVNTKGEDCNVDGKIYDAVTRTCVTAP